MLLRYASLQDQTLQEHDESSSFRCQPGSIRRNRENLTKNLYFDYYYYIHHYTQVQNLDCYQDKTSAAADEGTELKQLTDPFLKVYVKACTRVA